MRGQVALEFLLIVVVMLMILSSVSIPGIDELGGSLRDAFVGVSLGASQQKILLTAREVSVMPCGSVKSLSLFLEPDVFAGATLSVDRLYVSGSFFGFDNSRLTLNVFELPEHVSVSFGSVSNNFVPVTFTKDCNEEYPTVRSEVSV